MSTEGQAWSVTRTVRALTRVRSPRAVAEFHRDNEHLYGAHNSAGSREPKRQTIPGDRSSWNDCLRRRRGCEWTDEGLTVPAPVELGRDATSGSAASPRGGRRRGRFIGVHGYSSADAVRDGAVQAFIQAGTHDDPARPGHAERAHHSGREDNGARSNPQARVELDRLGDLCRQLRREVAQNPRWQRSELLRVSPVLEMVALVLERADRPMRARDIRTAAEMLAGMPLRWPSVKAALSAGASGTHDAFSGSATASTGWQGSAGCLAPVLAIVSFAPLSANYSGACSRSTSPPRRWRPRRRPPARRRGDGGRGSQPPSPRRLERKRLGSSADRRFPFITEAAAPRAPRSGRSHPCLTEPRARGRSSGSRPAPARSARPVRGRRAVPAVRFVHGSIPTT